jgi:hypothetical protein
MKNAIDCGAGMQRQSGIEPRRHAAPANLNSLPLSTKESAP